MAKEFIIIGANKSKLHRVNLNSLYKEFAGDQSPVTIKCRAPAIQLRGGG